MKIIFLYLLILLMSSSCENNNCSDILKGSWYTVNKDIGLYEEIHVNDSIFVYCYGENADIIVPLNYTIQEDTVFLFNDNKAIIDKYQISLIKGNTNQVLLKNSNKKLLFNRLDIAINNLDSIFTSTETLEAFSDKFYERAKERL